MNIKLNFCQILNIKITLVTEVSVICIQVKNNFQIKFIEDSTAKVWNSEMRQARRNNSIATFRDIYLKYKNSMYI